MAEHFGKLKRYRNGWRLDLRPHGYLYTDNGMRFESRAHAKGVLASIRHRIAGGAAPADVVRRLLPKDGKQNRVGVHLQRWLKAQTVREASGDLSPTYLRELRRYASPKGYFGPLLERSIHSLDFPVLEDWVADLRVSGTTKRRAIGALSAFLHWLKRRGEIGEQPDLPTVQVDEYTPTIISIEDQDRIIAEIPEPRRGAFLAMRLGVRPGEARALNVDDYTNGCLRIAHAMKGPTSKAPRRSPKSRKTRFVEIDRELADWITTYRRHAFPAEPLFQNPTGRRDAKRWLDNALREEWGRAAARVGVECSVYEGTKHSSASAAARRGVRLEVLQLALGHADPRSTARYSKLAPMASVSVLRPGQDECSSSAGLSDPSGETQKQK
jgi:integrase